MKKPYTPTNMHADVQPDAEELSDEGFYGRPSKSQRKRDVEALQDLGARLVELTPEQIKRIEMPDELRAALKEAHRLTPRCEAMRRQIQFIGRIMRKVDPAPLQAALDRLAGLSAIENARMHKREKLRERFIADERVITEIANMYPEADIQYLRQLRRNAIKEHEQQRPPKSYREIYRVLRELEDGVASPAATDSDIDDTQDIEGEEEA